MKELVRTNDPALISYVEALLKELDVQYHIADQAISAAEGSILMFPKRILVIDEHAAKARELLIDAGLEAELRPDKPEGFWQN